MQQVIGQNHQENPQSTADILKVLRKAASKGEALNILVAYVLGVDYPDQLFCLNEADPQAVGNVFRRRAFHVLADANKEERRDIEELTRNEGWLKPRFEWGDRNRWYYGPLYCYEEKVAKVRHIFLVPCAFLTVSII